MTSPVLPAEPVGRVVFATATLSFVGGFVDVVGFIALFGLFTAHVTGNFIMLGLEMVHATKLAIAKLLAVPVFIVMVALTRLLPQSGRARQHDGNGGSCRDVQSRRGRFQG